METPLHLSHKRQHLVNNTPYFVKPKLFSCFANKCINNAKVVNILLQICINIII
jgi:hypothetical protein